MTKVSELEGALLDAAVAKALGITLERRGASVVTASYDENHLAAPMRYSENWAYGGPIIERERIAAAEYRDGDKAWGAMCHAYISAGGDIDTDCVPWQSGPTYLVAAMRAYVASKLGEEVELP